MDLKATELNSEYFSHSQKVRSEQVYGFVADVYLSIQVHCGG